MALLALLHDGSCSQAGTCMKSPSDVHASCPQVMKCGSCVAWSPRQENRYGRNSGQCMLDRSSTQFLDCNASICPYYRPRVDSPAFAEWQGKAAVQKRVVVRERTRRMDREVPPPGREALAQAAFRDHDAAVASAGAAVLEGMLASAGGLPVLLERFRGGTVRVAGRDVPLEALWARLALLRRSLQELDDALGRSSLDADTRDKVARDLAGIGGSMTTFNVLFKEKSEAFKGSGKGE